MTNKSNVVCRPNDLDRILRLALKPDTFVVLVEMIRSTPPVAAAYVHVREPFLCTVRYWKTSEIRILPLIIRPARGWFDSVYVNIILLVRMTFVPTINVRKNIIFFLISSFRGTPIATVHATSGVRQ